MFSFGYSASKKQEVLSFLRKVLAADGPAPDALALLAGFRLWHQAGAFWGFRVLSCDRQ